MSATILVVDDSAYARRILRRTLETAGYAVQEAGSGMAALESYFLQRPSLVLLDLTMGDMSGLDVLHKLRELDPSARVIVVSADVQSTTGSIVGDAGAMRFLPKPTPSETLLAAVAEALEAADS